MFLFNKPLYIQKGRILFNFIMKKTFCSLLSCYNPSFVPFHTYNDYFDENYINSRDKDNDIYPKKRTRTVSEFDSKEGSLNKKPTLKNYGGISDKSCKEYYDQNECIDINRFEENGKIYKTQEQFLNNNINIIHVLPRINNIKSSNNFPFNNKDNIEESNKI